MTEQDIKEELSRSFVSSIAHSKGIMCSQPSRDYGVDLCLTPIVRRMKPNGGTRLLESPNKLDIQLKATTITGVDKDDHFVKYDLEVKNYNDLIQRKDDVIPLYLVLVVFDFPPPQCLSVSDTSLSFHGQAYWYTPSATDAESTNDTTQRIYVPLDNQLREDFAADLFSRSGIAL